MPESTATHTETGMPIIRVERLPEAVKLVPCPCPKCNGVDDLMANAMRLANENLGAAALLQTLVEPIASGVAKLHNETEAAVVRMRLIQAFLVFYRALEDAETHARKG